LPEAEEMIMLVAVLFAPGLIGFTLLMQWMEVHLTGQLVAHEVQTVWNSALTPEEIEAAVARSTARLFQA
jgi:hypothetical protein